MRRLWILPLWVAIGLMPLTRSEGQQAGAPQGGEAATQGQGQDDGAFRPPSLPRQPLGAFQPTDIGGGDKNQPSEGPEPPQILSPDPAAAPAGGAEPPSLLRDEPQTVAPAQFQSPAPAKKTPEPKTTVVPGSAAPAFQPAAPPASAPPAASAPAANQPEPQNLAQSLYQQASTPPATGALAGSELTLHEALVRRTDSSRYAEFVKAYWSLSRSTAAYYEHVQGATELSRLPQSRVPQEQALLQAARSEAEAELRSAKLQAVSAQFDLGEQFSGNAAALPLARDLPLMTAYKSKFEAVFANRVPPPGARRLHETFDVRLAVIEGRAAALVDVENAFASLAEAYAGGQATLADALREHRRLQAARLAFLESVYDYNAAIADYAYLAAGPHRSPETIVSMLVERRKPAGNQDVAPANFNSPGAR